MTLFPLADAASDAAKEAASIAAENADRIISLHDNVMFWSLAFAGFSLACGAIAYVVSALLAYQNALTTNVIAQKLPPKPPEGAEALVVPNLDAIAKIFDSLKGLVDSLSKASPMIVWVLSAMVFTGIAAYVAPDACQSCEKPAATSNHQETKSTLDCKDQKNATNPKCIEENKNK